MGIGNTENYIYSIVGENDILEYRGPDTNKSNLNLDHLGRVLQTIRSTLPGKTYFTIKTDFLQFFFYVESIV